MNKTSLDIIKEAILLERNGENFYRVAAEKAETEKSRELFNMLAEEEVQHRILLEKTFTKISKSGTFEYSTEPSEPDFNGPVIDENFRESLKEAHFDSSAISIALTLEEKAAKFYQEKSEMTDDPEAKKLLNWLARWEQKHHKYFYELDQEIRESVWNDSNFWPLY